MGAIRTSELVRYGMQGYGDVYHRYATDPDFDDDEVTLIHGVSAPYFPVSEPMIHFRSAITHLVDGTILGGDAANRIIRFMKERWYGERTLQLFAHALSNEGVSDSARSDLMSSFDNHRLKRLDLEQFVRQGIAFPEEVR